MSAKIKQLEPQFAQKLDSPLKSILQELQYPVPQNFRLRVSLLDANKRKKRSNAKAENWSPATGRVEIWFEPALPEQKEATSKTSDKVENVPVSNTKTQPRPIEILLRALDRAERTPGWRFVSLKKFRDELLYEPIESGAWKPTDVEWQALLNDAIEKRLILTGHVQNPKPPYIPVTTIRLNWSLPEVQAIFGQRSNDMDFHPVEIHGEPLSATILRERR